MIELLFMGLAGAFVGFIVLKRLVTLSVYDEFEYPLASCDVSMVEECLAE